MSRETVPLSALTVRAFTLPTDGPESDGTLEWDSITAVVVEARAGSERGLGYTYADVATAQLVDGRLRGVVVGRDAMATTEAWTAMQGAVRNLGQPGVAQMAISAVDAAVWDLKARLLDVSLADLLGPCREAVPVYGSGGFTTYDVGRLGEQLRAWVDQGIAEVKMKVGRQPGDDVERVAAARKAVGDRAGLFVDANGAYGRKQALEFAHAFAGYGVTWFEEPVSSNDLEGLRLLRDRVPAPIEIAAGEYGYIGRDFVALVGAGAVDVLQADITRCGGVTGLLAVGSLCRLNEIPLSAHTAPQLHAHVCTAIPPLLHIEYFHDHVRAERLLFDGVLEPHNGTLRPDRSRPGHGLELKYSDAAPYLVYSST